MTPLATARTRVPEGSPSVGGSFHDPVHRAPADRRWSAWCWCCRCCCSSGCGRCRAARCRRSSASAPPRPGVRPSRRPSASTSRSTSSTSSSCSARCRATSGSRPTCCPGDDAFDIFLMRLPATIELAFFAMVIAIALGIPLGYFAARRRGSASSTTARSWCRWWAWRCRSSSRPSCSSTSSPSSGSCCPSPGARTPASTPPGSPGSSSSTASSPGSGTRPGTHCST